MSAKQIDSADWVKRGNYAASHFRPDQGRVLFHQERIFRSAGGPGVLAHADYIALAKAAGLPRLVNTWTPAQVVRGLQLIERAARGRMMHHFRDVRTQWEPLARAVWDSAPEEYRATLRDTLHFDGEVAHA